MPWQICVHPRAHAQDKQINIIKTKVTWERDSGIKHASGYRSAMAWQGAGEGMDHGHTYTVGVACNLVHRGEVASWVFSALLKSNY